MSVPGTENSTTVEGVGLSGSGFLAFFFVGVLSALRDLGLIDQAKTSFAGASGGAIIAMAVIVTASNILVQFLILDGLLTWGAFTYPLAFLVSEELSAQRAEARRAAL